MDPRPHATDYGWTQHEHHPNWTAIIVAALLTTVFLLAWRCSA